MRSAISANEVHAAVDAFKQSGGPAFADKMIGKFLENYFERTTRLNTALAGRDLETLTQQAHNLKSVVAVFGAKNLADSLRLLESFGREGAYDKAAELTPAILEGLETLRNILSAHLTAKR